jgi:23S rRNA pseudouridine1911/1915/1917 synthase
MTRTFEATGSGQRIDVFLADNLPDTTRSAAQRLLEEGRVMLLGRPVKKNHRVSAGQIITVSLPERITEEILPQAIPLDIIYEDSDIIAVNKPRGMVVHPAPGHPDGTLVNALMEHCDCLSEIGGITRPGIVHRIDKDTSGLIMAAKNDFAHLKLAGQLKDHSLARVYEAIVHGRVKEDYGTVNEPIGRHPTDRKRQAVTDKNSRPAVTHYEVITRYAGYTHVRCRLETGRTHQIRVHMAYIGNPLLGDLVYGRKKPDKGLSGQCLHAKELSFLHPRSGKAVELSCPLPGYFTEILLRLGEKE